MVAKQRGHAAPSRVRNGLASDLEPLVCTFSESFSTDPLLNWVIPSARLYPDYFRLLLREVYLPSGMIHVENSGRAAALWLPPEQHFYMAPGLSLLLLRLRILRRDGFRGWLRMRSQGRLFQSRLPREPHYHLQFIGCRKDAQGKGIGGTVLQHGTQVCDADSMPAYLESSNLRNLPLYQRHGFSVIGEETIGRDGPTVWFMWRDPR